MIRLTIFIAALILFTWESLEAQEQITLNEAIDIAVDNNTMLRQMENNVERSELDIRNQRANYLPSLNLNTQSGITAGQQFDASSFEFGNFVNTTGSGSINTGIDLFTGFQRINNLRSARAGHEIASSEYERTKEQVIFNTAQAYLEVLLEKELLEITRENLETSRRQLEQVEAQVEVGTVPSVDMYDQRAEVANTELELIRRENALEMAKTQFIGYLQIDPFVDYELVAPEIEDADLIPQDYELRQLVEEAMANRRDVVAARKEIEQSNYDISAAEGGRYPTISLSGQLSTNYSERRQDPITEETIPFTEQFFDLNVSRNAGISVSIPLFNRFQTSNEIEHARISRRDAQLNLEDLQFDVIQEIRQAYNDYRGYSKELEATETALQAAEMAFETQRERYEVGSATLLELTEAQNRFVEAQSNRITAQYQFIFQEKILDYYLGRISEDPDIVGM